MIAHHQARILDCTRGNIYTHIIQADYPRRGPWGGSNNRHDVRTPRGGNYVLGDMKGLKTLVQSLVEERTPHYCMTDPPLKEAFFWEEDDGGQRWPPENGRESMTCMSELQLLDIEAVDKRSAMAAPSE